MKDPNDGIYDLHIIDIDHDGDNELLVSQIRSGGIQEGIVVYERQDDHLEEIYKRSIEGVQKFYLGDINADNSLDIVAHNY